MFNDLLKSILNLYKERELVMEIYKKLQNKRKEKQIHKYKTKLSKYYSEYEKRVLFNIEITAQKLIELQTFDKEKVDISLKNIYLYSTIDDFHIRYNFQVNNFNISEIELIEYTFNIKIGNLDIQVENKKEINEKISQIKIIPETEYKYILSNDKWEKIKNCFQLDSSGKEYIGLTHIFYTLTMKIKEINTIQTHTIEYKDKIGTFKNVMRGRL